MNNSTAGLSPRRLFLTLLVLIFGIELVMMLSLHYLFPERLSAWAEAVVDAALLTAIIAIFVWRLMISPLRLAVESEAARAKAIMDSAAEGIVTIDESGRIESLNHAAEGMFGYEAANVVGANVKLLMPEPHASEHDGYIARYLRTGEARAIGHVRKLMARRKDGVDFPVEINVTELRFGAKRHFTAILRDVTEREQAERRVQALAYFDSLTGLANRALFYDRLGQAMTLAGRDGHEVGLLFVDLDRFKAVNDMLGHDVGDALLKSVAERLLGQVRKSDTVSRIGGDEFTVVLPRIASRQDAAQVARKIIGALGPPFNLGEDKREVRIGASIGIAVYPADAQDADVLVKAADAAMYAAKQVGNSCRFCNS